MESTTGIQRNIVKEILRECYPKKLSPNENFVAFYVKLLLLDPNWGITDNYMNTRVKIQSFVKHFIDELDQESIKLYTLEMQFSFQCYLDTVAKQIDNHRFNLLKRLTLLKMDICKVREPKDQSQFFLLSKKIVYYITLVSGLGSPTNNQVFAEAFGALKSILDENDLKEFVSLPKQLKESQLLYFSKIVCGIRLFNKDCGKGGAGIPKLPSLLDSAIHTLKDELQKTLLYVMSNVNMLTTFIEQSYELTQSQCPSRMMRIDDFSEEVVMKAKDLLIMSRQYELSIRKLIGELGHLEQETGAIYDKFRSSLKEVHNTVQLRIAVSINIVFPLFEKLADLWIQMQNQVITLTVHKTILRSLENFTSNTEYRKVMQCMDAVSMEINPISDAERLELTAKYTLTSANDQIFVYKPEKLDDLDTIKLQYLGFCPWKLVQTNGGLIPGNPNMGLVKYQGLYYVFSCPEAFTEFSKEPDQYIMRILTLAREKPQLITFLDLRNQLEAVVDQYHLVKVKIHEKRTRETGVQTCQSYEEVVPPNKDKLHKWNVWDLKRDAIGLATASKCLTVSTQTIKTHSRKAVEMQTYKKRSVTTQTKKDNYTNVPRPSTFIFGLRGQKGKRQFVVDLTQPVSF